MVFSSLLFLFRFLPVIILAYYMAPTRLRNGVLFIGSLVFYGWGEPVYITLLLFSTLVDFFHGQMVEYFLKRGETGRARMTVASSAVINLGLLCFFKYTDFLLRSANEILGTHMPLLELALPVGISFYTFQTMSYTIDVYRGEVKAQKDLIAFGTYVSMFPQLIAGPIVRYHTIARELSERQESLSQFSRGVRRFCMGLGKKVLIANQTGALFSEISGMFADDRSILLAWLGILAFGMQIYFDFSGYSDMAAGLGSMFGFHFPENFRYPYTASSITEFWRRWHISLGTWFREYVYIPLGGNRRGSRIQIRNILIVWLLTGIWHGAGFNFLLWGLYFGFLLLAEKRFLQGVLARLPRAAGIVYAQVLVFLGWVLFAFEDMGQAGIWLSQMAGVYRTAAGSFLPLVTDRTVYLFLSNLLLLSAAVLGATRLPALGAGFLMKLLEKRRGVKRVLELGFCLFLLLFSTAFLVNAGYNPFLYFRF